MLPKDGTLDGDTMARILAKGFSRIPVMQENEAVAGIVLVKNLITLDPEVATPIAQLFADEADRRVGERAGAALIGDARGVRSRP